jgi:hypothetical protein
MRSKAFRCPNENPLTVLNVLYPGSSTFDHEVSRRYDIPETDMGLQSNTARADLSGLGSEALLDMLAQATSKPTLQELSKVLDGASPAIAAEGHMAPHTVNQLGYTVLTVQQVRDELGRPPAA